MKIETPTLQRKVWASATTSARQPKFVSASSIMDPIPEMTDEEILKYTIEFERAHGFTWIL